LAAADAAAVLAAQAEADALAAFNSAQAALDLLIANSAPQVDIDAATVVRDDAQVALNSAELASDAADATAAAALAVANATDAGALQAAATQAAADDAAAAAALAVANATDAGALQAAATAAAADDAAAAAALAVANATDAGALQAAATQAAADDAAAAAALAVANATDAGALQAAATQAAADDAAAAAAQAVANATDAGALQAAATQAAADDAAAAAAQAAATAAANADAALMVALNNYVTALAADQAADAAAATADAAADAAEAADAVEAAAAAAATAANNAAAGAAAAEAAALAALNQAQADLTAASTNPAGKDPVGNNPVLEAAGLGKVVRDDPNTAAVETNYIRVQGGEHVVVGGTNQNDTIITDFGDDGIWGDAGDDRIESGAGVDLVNGGSGNDVLTDSGDTGDFIKGDEGDDVIAGGNGLDIYMGGDGKDVIFHGVDDAETFAGQGDDFVLGGLGVDLIMGNEGDDWLEAGAGFDTTAGDNSELFFDSKIIGHDVMFSGSEEHDFDAESGDDIMVQGESVLRNEGMFGFDWVTYKGNPNAADVDLARPIFTTEVQDVLRDRFDKVEAASGYTGNDLLVGDDRIYDANANANVNATAEGVFFRDDINQAGIDRIAGLDQIITDREMFSGLYTSEFGDLKPGATAEKIFAGGNVLIGGAGSDTLIGKGGNDILDGDRWLNVRIRLTAPGDDNTAENELATIDSLTHVFTAPQLTALGIDTVHAGRSLSALLIDRLIVPSQMHIVREILDGGQNGDVDTAVFWDEVQNYTVTEEDDGSYIVTHNTVGNPLVLPPGFLRPISDGVDTLRNIELIRFGDGNGGFRTFNIADVVQRPATGAAVLTGDLTPIEGQTLTVSTAGISDPNGIAGFAFQWQSSVDGTTWVDIDGETGATLNIPDADGTALGALHGLNLRAVVTLTDNFGETQVFTTGSTARVGQNLDVSDSAVGVTFVMPDTDDVLTGSDLADNIRGFLGDDVLLGGDGDDLLLGGQGNDVVDGGAGIDTAGFGNGIANFTIAVAPGTTDLLIVNGVVSGADVVRNVEILQFNGQNYTVVMDNTDGASALNGGAGFQAIFGRTGNDTLDGGLNADLLVGGEGDDTILGGGGLDWIYQIGATDGRDFIDGGAGTDTYTLSGVAGAETFDIYTRTAYLTANPGAVLVGGTNTEIVITRNGSIIAELDNIEEIRVNSLLTTSQNGNGIVDGGVADGDTVNIIGDFNATSLLFNTIRVNGTDANDTVNIAGLESAHRVVFTTNGGSDTMLGAVRDQDIINGSVIDQRTTSVAAPMAAAAVASTSFGAFDGLDALVRSGLRGSLLDQSFGAADGLLGGAPGRVEFRTLGLDDLNIFSREAVDFTPMQQSVGRTMIDTHDLMPLDLADFGPAPAAVEIGSVHDAVTGFDYRSIGADFWVLP
jgi:Ca2+-binding RTX toxin-like protein